MSLSSSKFDANSSSSTNDLLSMTKQFLKEFVEEDSSMGTKTTQDLVQTLAVHIPVIISTTMVDQKHPHGSLHPVNVALVMIKMSVMI